MNYKNFNYNFNIALIVFHIKWGVQIYPPPYLNVGGLGVSTRAAPPPFELRLCPISL